MFLPPFIISEQLTIDLHHLLHIKLYIASGSAISAGSALRLLRSSGSDPLSCHTHEASFWQWSYLRASRFLHIPDLLRSEEVRQDAHSALLILHLDSLSDILQIQLSGTDSCFAVCHMILTTQWIRHRMHRTCSRIAQMPHRQDHLLSRTDPDLHAIFRSMLH